MATYVNDLRLTELATGEGSGTWGVTTNTNLELIGEALGYGTQDCFATDADATTTVADGATDPARAMYFKVTSSATLTATRTLTIAPNTMTRVMLIENATTGSQSIAISQGSGGNVTIASGQVKMVYLDGAGAGAAVVDAMASLELGTITVANLTATTADINGGTIDGATIATSDITVGAGKTLDVSAGTFTVANDQISGDAINGGTATPTTLTSTTVNATTVDTTNIEVTNLKAKDGTAAGSIADSTGVVTLSSSVLTTTDINGGTIDGVTIGGASAGAGTFTNLTATGTTTLAGASTTADITFGDNDKAIFGAGSDLQIYHDGSNSYIVDSGTGNLVLEGGNLRIRNVGSSQNFITADNGGATNLFYAGSAKLATTATGIDVTGTVTTDGLASEIATTGRSVLATFANTASLSAGNQATIELKNSGQSAFITGEVVQANAGMDLVFSSNDSSSTETTRLRLAENGDISFYEDTGTTPKFFWDASAESLGIGTSTPASTLDVDGDVTADGLTVEGIKQIEILSGKTSLVTGSAGVYIYRSGTSAAAPPFDVFGNLVLQGRSNAAASIDFVTGITPAHRMRIDTGGDISFYENTGTTEKFFWDASAERLGIGTTSPGDELEISAGGPIIRLTDSDNSAYGRVACADGNLILQSDRGDTSASSHMRFDVDDTERMRIDSSGNLLVGKTANDNTTAGFKVQSGGFFSAVADGTTTCVLNRLTSDGEIAIFRKDGTTVGSIGIESGGFVIDGEAGHTGLRFGASQVIPRDNGADTDGLSDLGFDAGRWRDLYLSGGVYLGGTAAANKLDDYEEGLYDATLTPETSGTITVTSSSMAYTKIGRQVTVTGQLDIASVSSPVGGYVNMSLPFSIATLAGTSERAGGAQSYNDDSSSVISAIPCIGLEGAITVRLILDASTLAASDDFYIQYTYFTS